MTHQHTPPDDGDVASRIAAHAASTSGLVEQWFGPGFAELHPLLQRLHREGGMLSGTVRIDRPRGVAGWVGARLARRLGVPVARGDAHLQVRIHGDAQGLHWDRDFDGRTRMRSLFVPVGHWPDGYWLERSAAITLALQVIVRDGGWYWRTRSAWLGGVRLPLVLLPRTAAGKRIEGDAYVFHVDIALPVLGTVLRYEGRLRLDSAIA